MDQEVIDYCYEVAKTEFKGRSVVQGFTPTSWGATLLIVYQVEDKLSHVTWIHRACHGCLGYGEAQNKHPRASCVAILSLCANYDHLAKFHWSEEALTEYYRYIANEGPMAHMFVTKDPNQMMEQGILLDPTKDLGGHLLMACIQTRQPWELCTGLRVQIYTRLFTRGVNHQLAFVLAMASEVNGGKLLSFNYHQNIGSNHSPYSGYPLSLGAFRKFLKGIPNKPTGTPYLAGGYYGVHDLFKSEGDSKISASLQRILRRVIHKGVAPQPAVVAKNPFERLAERLAVQPAVGYDLNEVLDRVADFLLIFQKEIMQPVKTHTWDKGIEIA